MCLWHGSFSRVRQLQRDGRGIPGMPGMPGMPGIFSKGEAAFLVPLSSVTYAPRENERKSEQRNSPRRMPLDGLKCDWSARDRLMLHARRWSEGMHTWGWPCQLRETKPPRWLHSAGTNAVSISDDDNLFAAHIRGFFSTNGPGRTHQLRK